MLFRSHSAPLIIANSSANASICFSNSPRMIRAMLSAQYGDGTAWRVVGVVSPRAVSPYLCVSDHSARWRRSLAYASYAVWPVMAMPAPPRGGAFPPWTRRAPYRVPAAFPGSYHRGGWGMWGLAAWVNGGLRRRDRSAAVEIADPPPRQRVAPGGGAARRALARLERLRPANDSPDAFDEWLAELGVTLPDEDALAVYLDICELAGWDATGRPTATAAAPVVPDLPAPPQTTVVAVVTSGQPAPAEPAPSEIIDDDGLIELSPEVAARGFVDWCRVHGKAGTYDSDQLTAISDAYFADERLVPVAERPFRAALALVSGVSRVRPKTRKKGRRPVSWQITSAATVSSELPWSDLERRAA